jgi:carbon monoxide dehydrogenase subunit G
MAKIQASVTIERPAEAVWRFIMDTSTWPELYPDVLDVKQTSPGPLGLGTTFSARMQRWGNLSWHVKEYEPNKKYTDEFTSPGFIKGMTDTISLETFEGKTRLTEIQDMKVNGFYRLLGPYITRTARRTIRARLDKTKYLLESETP